VSFVEEALGRGYRLAIATSPLFPLTAIQQRLAWAGLPVEKYPFAVVSSYETFHFAKPNPAYYAEMLARLGWPEGPVVMVGNELVNDVSPARQSGLPVFCIAEESISPDDEAGFALLERRPGRHVGMAGWQFIQDLRPDYSLPSRCWHHCAPPRAALDSCGGRWERKTGWPHPSK